MLALLLLASAAPPAARALAAGAEEHCLSNAEEHGADAAWWRRGLLEDDAGVPEAGIAMLQTSIARLRPDEPEVPAAPSWPADYWGDDLDLPQRGRPRRRSRSRGEALVQEAAKEGYDFRQNSGSRILVYPEKKLAFCYIEKNACTQFNSLFNSLNRRNATKSGPWWQSTAPSFNLDVHSLTKEKGWTWAVFLRDPMLRYLSAWGSKCVQREDDGENCLPRQLLSRGSVRDFETNVVANFRHPQRLAENPHWALQQDFCGGLRNARGYDFVGHLRGDVNAQVRKMLKMVGASEAGADKFFPRHRKIQGHRSSLDPYRYYNNVTIQRYVWQMYRKDYSLPV